jgi:HPt (histidine-containing phosphotransfer) domain-containing protein
LPPDAISAPIKDVSQPPPNDALRDLSSFLGDTATKEIVQVFLADFPATIEKMLTSGQEDQLRLAHSLKSSALHMGSEGLSKRMAELEDRLSRPGGAVVPGELAEAMSDFEAFASDLRKYASA